MSLRATVYVFRQLQSVNTQLQPCQFIIQILS